ncbi:styrene monooxygenase NADH-dependent flavin reductase subunit StyB [Rhodococcus baikonurensis]
MSPRASTTAPTPTPDEVAAITQMNFRTSVALFATGIAVVTMDDGEGGVHGVTVNSFTSISLDPPTVMVSLRPGRAHDLISSAGVYGVSVLTESQQNHSKYFTGAREDNWSPEFLTGATVPTLAGSLARFECRVTDTIAVHDHTLFLARVEHCDSDQGSPLMFFASKYHQPALTIPSSDKAT